MAAALTSAFRLGTGPASERMLAAAVDANGGLLGVASFHDTWARTQDALVQELAATTLAQIAAIDAGIEAGACQPSAPSPYPAHRSTRQPQLAARAWPTDLA